MRFGVSFPLFGRVRGSVGMNAMALSPIAWLIVLFFLFVVLFG